jgi:hypothetical protein
MVPHYRIPAAFLIAFLKSEQSDTKFKNKIIANCVNVVFRSRFLMEKLCIHNLPKLLNHSTNFHSFNMALKAQNPTAALHTMVTLPKCEGGLTNGM